MIELMKSLKATLYERMGSPLFGAFIAFWVYFNWKAVVLLVANDEDIYLRIAEIELHHSNPANNYWCPLLYAGLFSIFYPYISVIPYLISRHARVLKVKVRDWVEDTVTIPVEDYHKLKLEIADNDGKVSTLLNKRSSNEDRLVEQLEELRSVVTKLRDKSDKNSARINEINPFNDDETKKVRETITRVVNGLTNLVSTNYSEGLGNLVSKILEGTNDPLVCAERINIMSHWLSHIRYKVEIDILAPSVNEIGDFIRELIHISEQVRNAIKNNLSKSDDKNHFSDLKEDWGVVSMRINNVVVEWNRFLSENREVLGRDGGEYFAGLKPIEYNL